MHQVGEQWLQMTDALLPLQCFHQDIAIKHIIPRLFNILKMIFSACGKYIRPINI